MKPFDDPKIKSDDMIIRGIHESHLTIDHDGQKILSSAAFSQSSEDDGGMSVYIESLIIKDGYNTQKHIMKSGEYRGAVYLNVGDVRAENLQVGHTPLPGNPYHGEVWGKSKIKYNRKTRQRLKAKCKWCVKIPNVSIPRN